MIKLLLRHGAYSYRENAIEQELSSYWRALYWEYVSVFSTPESLSSSDTYFASYNDFLLAGVIVPLDQSLPWSLKIAQNHIEATIAKCFSPLQLEEDVWQKVTPYVLRALPRLLKRVKEARGKSRSRFVDSQDRMARF